MLSAGSTVYLGGQFDYLGPYTGGSGLVDVVTGSPSSKWPQVNGYVLAAIPDGSGGWYLGGDFASINFSYYNNMVHILPNQTIDSNFVANTDVQVDALLLQGTTLYMGGQFTTINGQGRYCFGAVEKASGTVLPFNPQPNDSVFAMALSGTTLYAGGAFTTMGGLPRAYLAAVDASGSTGWATAFNPTAGGGIDGDGPYVLALAVQNTTLYAGGYFTTMGGLPRVCLAAVDASGSTGWATSFDATLTQTASDAYTDVWALAVSGTALYVGGDFSGIGGQIRSNIAAVDASGSTGWATSWDPESDDSVYSLFISATTVYVGGHFTNIGSQPRQRVAEIDLASATATSWDPDAGGDVFFAGSDGTNVLVGGYSPNNLTNFYSIGGVTRNYVAALSVSTGKPTTFNPGMSEGPTDSFVNAMALSGTTLYLGGDFNQVSGTTANYIAAVNTSNGVPLAVSLGADAPVWALAVTSTVLYVGGDFLNAGGQARQRLAALDTTTGLATGFNPGADNRVDAITVTATSVFVGGEFANCGGQSRSFLAALDPAVGAAEAGFNPNPNNTINTLALNGAYLYIGGAFTSVGAKARERIAMVDASSGSVTAFNAGSVNGDVNDMLLRGNYLYVGGGFNIIGGATRYFITALNALSGTATIYDSGVYNYAVDSVCMVGDTLFVGGLFIQGFSGYYAPHLASLSDAAPTPFTVPQYVGTGKIEVIKQPVQDSIDFAIQASSPGAVTIEVYNAAMEHVATFRENLSSENQQIFYENHVQLANGVYVYSAKVGSFNFPVGRFWVQH